jgi:hypothetical protein
MDGRKYFTSPLWMKRMLTWMKNIKIEIKKIKTCGRFGLVPNLSSPKSQVRNF